MSIEIEVFRISELDTNKCYEFALHTRTEGQWPNQTYYTTNELQYVGKYVSTTINGYRDGATFTLSFDNQGKPLNISLDYEGKSCFREVPCKITAQK